MAEMLRNTYNNWCEVEKAINEGGGGGGGDVTKEYVDTQDNALSARITTNTTNIGNKQDKLTDETQSGDLTDNNTFSDVSLSDKKNKKWTLLKLWNWVKNKLITTIGDSVTDGEIASAKATKKYVDDKVRYVHTMVRYNNDSKEFPMGWWKYIDDKETATITDFKNFLKNGGYTSKEKAWYWTGGCVGTATVRNGDNTGTTYVGRPASGVYYIESEDSMYFKSDYNAQTTIVYTKVKLFTEQI